MQTKAEKGQRKADRANDLKPEGQTKAERAKESRTPFFCQGGCFWNLTKIAGPPVY
jgi:hypothetical protein